MTMAAPGDQTRPSVQWRGPFRAAVALLAGGLLLCVAVPQTIAAWKARGAALVAEKLNGPVPPLSGELDGSVEALKQAISWMPSAKRLTDLALIETTKALRLRLGDQGRPRLLADAEEHLSAGLAANPADGSSWIQLAFVRQLRGQQGRAIAAPLMQSLDVAPNVRSLWILRAELLMSNRQFLDRDELDSLRRQIRVIWSTEPPWPEAASAYKELLIEAGLRAGGWPLMTEALGAEPDRLAEFDKMRTAFTQKMQKR